VNLARLTTYIYLFCLLGLLITFAGCDLTSAETSSAQVSTEPSNQKETEIIALWYKENCETPQSMASLVGKSEADIVKLLGEAESEVNFTLSQNVTEFRIELLNLFALPQNNERKILERQWSNAGCKLTIWFTNTKNGMTSVQALRWPDGTEF